MGWRTSAGSPAGRVLAKGKAKGFTHNYLQKLRARL